MSDSPRWSDLGNLVGELGLRADPRNSDDVRQEIRARLRSLHPDRYAPDEWPAEARTQFLLLQSGLDFMNRDSSDSVSKAMVPVSIITDLVTLIKESRDEKPPAQKAQQSIEEAGAAAQAAQLTAIHQAYDPPRRTATIVSSAWAVLGGVFLLPQSAATNPFLQRILSIPGAFYWWLVVLIAGLLIMGLLFAREDLIKGVIRRMFSFEVQQRALTHLIRDERDQFENGDWDPEFDGPSPDSFSRHFLTRGLKAEMGLEEWYRHRGSSRARTRKQAPWLSLNALRRDFRAWWAPMRRVLIKVPDDVAESAVDLCIQRLIARGKIRSIDPRQGQGGDRYAIVLDDWFELVPAPSPVPPTSD